MVFTIYNCGTGYDEIRGEKEGEVIACLYFRTGGVRAKERLITAGPGSTCRNMSGYDPALDPTEYISRGVKEGIHQAVEGAVGSVSGYPEVCGNVKRVLEILSGLKHPPSRVNMAGWSRGACTCLAIANAMKNDKKLNGVPVNIIAFDPVPGTGNFGVLEWRIVPENVESYEAIFMENENRGIMGAAQLEFASSNTEKRLLHMPGGHWYAVVKETGYEEVARVGAYLAADFLTRRGTEIDTQGLDMSKDDRALLEDYSLMIQHTDAFFQKGGDDSCRCCGSHEAWFKVENHLLSKSPYFVNSHHKQVFKAVAGKLYDYLFMQNPLTSGASDFKKYSDGIVDKIFGSMPKDAYRQLMWIQAAAPKTWETLEDFAFFTQARALMARKRQQAFDKKYPKIEKSFAQYKQVA